MYKSRVKYTNHKSTNIKRPHLIQKVLLKGYYRIFLIHNETIYKYKYKPGYWWSDPIECPFCIRKDLKKAYKAIDNNDLIPYKEGA